MDFLCLEFLVVFVFLQGICGLPLGEKASEMQRNVLFEACTHNGTSYWEGEMVGIEDPCLSCVCRRGALECSLRVCADEPDVLPPGCFFVHKPNDCCPQLFCEEEGSSNPIGVELRTDFKLENKQNGNDCAINGSLYAEGSAVASTGHCEYCYCIEGEMKCLKPRCLRSFEGCRPIYEKSSCCPTQYDCRNADLESLEAQVKSFALSNSGSKRLPDDSPRALADSTESLNSSETAESPREELLTTTEELATNEMTVKPDKETTTLSSEDFLTSVGFQTVTNENSNRETTTTTTVSPTEEATLTEATTEDVEDKLGPFQRDDFPAGTDSSVASNGETRDNSSQEVDEYDSYDYGEPRLPPSLPNLVIFPFVAADAVVKDETDDVLDVQDKSEIKRIDAYPVFYKDYFSPPIKTEGGFVPKEPPASIEPFYEFGYVKKEPIEPPGLDLKEALICQDVICPPANGMNLSALKDTQPTTAGHVNAEVDSKTSFDFKEDKPMEFDKIQQDKKPVTVTYKNVVVDFYPNYLITTTRARPKTQPSITMAIAEESLTVDEEANSSTPPIRRTTEKSSFFDEFLKSFFSEVGETTTEATMRTSPSHKYSSKIRGQPNASIEKREKAPSNDSLLNVLIQPEEAVASKQKIYSSTLKHVKKEGTKSFTKTSFREPSATAVPAEENTDEDKNGAGALLKLAGCNIYGMMYRVGKVITELSGPCLECLCTDSGVQCRPLKC